MNFENINFESRTFETLRGICGVWMKDMYKESSCIMGSTQCLYSGQSSLFRLQIHATYGHLLVIWSDNRPTQDMDNITCTGQLWLQPWTIYTQSQKKRNFSSWIFSGARGQGHVTLDYGKSAYTMSIVKMMYNPRFTGIHSSPKERQLAKCCVSFEKECTKRSMGERGSVPIPLLVWQRQRH